jgi:hypothetical protein
MKILMVKKDSVNEKDLNVIVYDHHHVMDECVDLDDDYSIGLMNDDRFEYHSDDFDSYCYCYSLHFVVFRLCLVPSNE